MEKTLVKIMELDKEKTIVLEWLGYRVWTTKATDMDISTYLMYEGNGKPSFRVDRYNPQYNDLATFKQWNEIWENMDSETKFQYTMNLLRILSKKKPVEVANNWDFHTTKPEMRWKALLKTLRGLK